jgi:hypothetical protein
VEGCHGWATLQRSRRKSNTGCGLGRRREGVTVHFRIGLDVGGSVADLQVSDGAGTAIEWTVDGAQTAALRGARRP